MAELRDFQVLVADENRASREVLQYYLSSLGMKVSCVEDAWSTSSALESAHRDSAPFRLVLLDRRLRESPNAEEHSAAIPIIELAPIGQLRADGAQPSAGIAGLLAKPIQQSLLLQSITSVLGLVASERPRSGLRSPDTRAE